MRQSRRRAKSALSDAKKIIVRRRIVLGGGEGIPVGTDVTSEAKTWGNLRSLVKSGFVVVDPRSTPKSTHRYKPTPVVAAEPVSAPVDPAPSEAPPKAKPVALGDLKSSDKVSLIKASLELAGVDVDGVSKKSDLLELVAKHL